MSPTSSTSRRAGESTRRTFRARTLPLLVLLLCGMVVCPIAYFSGLERSNPVVYVAILGGVGLVFKVTERMLAGLDRTWGYGARGEEKVGKSLSELEGRGWSIFHDVEVEGWNIDHVAVGPTGVFTIETKSHRGRITYDGQQLLRGDKPLEKDFLKQAKGESMWLRARLEEKGLKAFVTPIVCFTRGFVAVPQDAVRPVRVVPLKWLLGALERGRVRYEGAELEAVKAAVREICGESAGSAA